ncbi:MAG: hypothetical protein MMC33_003992 [Icmadophila ericetorum]|nr:hypothetical protein [Icmadophila ericetorum]
MAMLASLSRTLLSFVPSGLVVQTSTVRRRSGGATQGQKRRIWRLYVLSTLTDPKRNGNPEVKNYRLNVHTWALAFIDLYLPYAATGGSIDLASGVQICIFQIQNVRLPARRMKQWLGTSMEFLTNNSFFRNDVRITPPPVAASKPPRTSISAPSADLTEVQSPPRQRPRL